uniref:Uncharacterized protein n=1 Tax=Pogona vitticeps TaxID=103695 RepID=A0A6J0UPT1_9SAUR
MTPGGLLLLLGPLALSAGLLAAPSMEASGASPPSSENPPQPLRRPVNKNEVGPSGRPKPSENPLLGSEERASFDQKAHLEVELNATPLKGKLISIDSQDLASESAIPKKGCLIKNNTTTSGDQPASGGKASGQPGNPGSGGKPASMEKPVNATVGHAGQGKPTSSAKPGSDGKPPGPAGHVAHETPASGGKPAPNNGSVVHGKPACGNKTAPHEKPVSGVKPVFEGKPKPKDQPEMHAGENNTEEEEDDDNFDDDDDDDIIEDDLSSLDQEGSNGDEDGFDKELDYGLGKSPFNPYEYHDAWSDQGSDDPVPGFAEDGPPEDMFGGNAGEPVLDVWGDLMRPPASEPQPRKRPAETGLLWTVMEGGGARNEVPAEAPPVSWRAP